VTSNKYKYLLLKSINVEYTELMSDQLKKFVKIKTRDAADYAAQGYHVVRNETYAQVEISELGAAVKTGDTMAILEWDEMAERALAKGLISVVARPQASAESTKKAKKKQDEEAPAAVEQPAPAPQPTPAPDPLPESDVNTSSNKTEELDKHEDPF
jgi:hypothetical protein